MPPLVSIKDKISTRFRGRGLFFAVLAAVWMIPVPIVLAAPVETYVDQAVPLPPLQGVPYNSPLTAGQMTLDDVLMAHPPAPVRSVRPPPPSVSASVPLLSAKSHASSQNIMMMQGMETILQQSGARSDVRLKAPRMPGAGPAADASSYAPAAVSGMPYQPGQEPKNLAVSASQPNLPPSSWTPYATAPATGGCEPRVSSWTKSCAEAGYPQSFTGRITGETRTTCPDGTLADVWIANSCAPPDEGTQTSSAALPSPTVSAPTALPAEMPPPPLSAPLPEPPPMPMLVRADGACGAVNGLAANSRPSYDLCASGEATEVLGDGPWRWTCKGMKGGMTVSCAAPVAVADHAAPMPPPARNEKPAGTVAAASGLEEGLCGSADGVGGDHAPATDLCVKGTPSRVNGNGPWTWACSGANGGQAAACTAPKKTDGVCGMAASAGADRMPANDLCAAGYAGAVTGDGPWNWTCSGLYGGAPALCSAAAKRAGICGGATLAGHKEMPKADLCSSGKASDVRGAGPWSWACNGDNGGASVSCSAPVSVEGVCGAANGVAATNAPGEGLCAQGTASRVMGAGPWTWNCAGVDGGSAQSCAAPLASVAPQPPTALPPMPVPSSSASAVPAPVAAPRLPVQKTADQKTADICGSAAELMALAAPEKDLCASGTPSTVTGNGPWTWTCADSSGHRSVCSTLSPAAPSAESFSAAVAKARSSSPETPPAMAVPSSIPTAPEAAVVCGAATKQSMAHAPTSELCTAGTASVVRGAGPWAWTCSKGKSKISCETIKRIDGACGPDNGSIQKFAPTRGLCESGAPTDVQGSGPWLWSCIGSGGGASSSCSATSEAQTRVDGSCGVAANMAATARPEANLCDSGVQSTVYGAGPWTWTCSGLNGGAAASCATQKNVPPAPPPPGPAVNGLCGAVNGVAMLVQPLDDLCAAGTATSVSGQGPWNWNCLGQNGGMTVSCTAPLQPPAPITGVCGSANGVPTLTTPRSGLCGAGISSAVSGRGPWTWSCSGTNGGSAVGCVAPLAGAGGTGPLPSLTGTDTNEAPAPRAITPPAPPVSGAGLVTPRLPSGPLPPIETGTMPQLKPSKSFASPPEPTALPPAFTPDEQGMTAPATAPDLPTDAAPLTPPPIRDTLQPPSALQQPMNDSQGNVIPGNHFVLSDDVSTIPFAHAADNIGNDVLPQLDRLVAVLQSNRGVRITLTAYAGSSDISPRDARRRSLARALAVRDYLTAKGVSSSRVDVRALGANISSGDPDRVDVKAN